MMKHTPFALNEAKQLCDELQHLVGMKFDPAIPEMGDIECVAVAPFDLQNKRRFLLFYLLYDDASRALEEEYHGLLYDVVVIARSTEAGADLMQRDIFSWLEKNNLALSDIKKPDIMPEKRYGT